jgi:hypothetical protein
MADRSAITLTTALAGRLRSDSRRLHQLEARAAWVSSMQHVATAPFPVLLIPDGWMGGSDYPQDYTVTALQLQLDPGRWVVLFRANNRLDLEPGYQGESGMVAEIATADGIETVTTRASADDYTTDMTLVKPVAVSSTSPITATMKVFSGWLIPPAMPPPPFVSSRLLGGSIIAFPG